MNSCWVKFNIIVFGVAIFYLLIIDDVPNVTPEKEQYLKIAFYLMIADVSVRNWLVATNMSMSFGNVYPSYDIVQLLIGWKFYAFESIGVNVCKK